MEVFDFCKTSRVIKEVAPDEPASVNMNGWDFTGKPADPYRRKFTVKLHGMYWYMDEPMHRLDLTTDPIHNAGRLLQFYRTHRLFEPFILNHEYLGRITCRFQVPVNIEPAMAESGGLIEAFEVSLIHHNPGY